MFWCEEGRDGDGTQLGAIIRDQDRLNQTFRHGTSQGTPDNRTRQESCQLPE